jgi:hypothetical protein
MKCSIVDRNDPRPTPSFSAFKCQNSSFAKELGSNSFGLISTANYGMWFSLGRLGSGGDPLPCMTEKLLLHIVESPQCAHGVCDKSGFLKKRVSFLFLMTTGICLKQHLFRMLSL